MSLTRAVLLVYREVDVKLHTGGWLRRRFHHVAREAEIADAVESFRGFPQLVRSLTDGAATVTHRIVQVQRPLTTLRQETPARFWPSPDDTREELEQFAPAGEYGSVFVLWPQRDFASGSAIPCDAWGLGMAASAWSNGATYAAVATAPAHAWRGEAPGEVWLHEWLHGVCAGFAQQGHTIPERGPDGADLHGYLRSPTTGWTAYYRDLMTGNVLENGRRVGIPLAAWSERSGERAAVDRVPYTGVL